MISFIILNYNGKEITERCIKSLLESVKSVRYEIIVVDNGSSDGSSQYLKNVFPEIKLVRESRNKFIYAYNDGVRAAKGEWVFLLNNDMVFENGFVDPIIKDFGELKNNDLFAIGSKLVKPSGETEKCVNCPFFKNGYLWVTSIDSNKLSPTIYVGAHAIFNKDKFLQIGGFDPIYTPFYSEDLDLSYRAWKMGWKVYVEPKSVIVHQHMATIGNFFDRKYVLRVAARNHFLFIWRNITSKRLFIQHVLFLPIILLGSLFIGKGYYIPAFFEALHYFKAIRMYRSKNAQYNKLNDTEILKSFREYFANRKNDKKI